MNTALEVRDYKPIGKGCLIGSFSIYVPAWQMIIRGLSYFNTGDRKWVSFPSRPFEKDGKKCYYNYIVLDKGVQDTFQKDCLEALKHATPGPASLADKNKNEEECPF